MVKQEEFNITNEQKRWNSLQFDNETVKIWLNDLLESKNKIYIHELIDRMAVLWYNNTLQNCEKRRA